MLVGLVLGILLLLIQKKFSLLMINDALAYPIEFHFTNLLIVILTILTLGLLASIIASSRISKNMID